VRTDSGMGLLGNTSIVLQQLLRTAAAVGRSPQQQQQQQQLSAAVLYWADTSGRVLSQLYSDLLAAGEGQPVVGCFPMFSKQCCVLARALQALEAAVRYCVPTDYALPASRCDIASSSSSGSSSRRVVPPSITEVETALVGMYPVLIHHGYFSSSSGSSSSGNSSSGNSSSGSRGLSCAQHQLLQAVLSMLLTSAKVWQQELQPAVCLEAMSDVTLAAALCMQKMGESQPAVGPPGTSAEPAAAVTAAALGVFGGAQVAYLVTRHLSCLQQQLRKWLDAGDAASAANWLAAGPPPQLTTHSNETNSVGVGASCPAHPARPRGPRSDACSQLKVLLRLVQASYDIVGSAARGDTNSLGLDAARQRLLASYPATKMLMDSFVKDMLAGLKGKTGGPSAWVPDAYARPKVAALQGQLSAFVDALQGYGSALAASLPSQFGCNWPGCVRLSGVSEGYGLVRGQACVCGGCRQAR
jgi:hypothetical protein